MYFCITMQTVLAFSKGMRKKSYRPGMILWHFSITWLCSVTMMKINLSLAFLVCSFITVAQTQPVRYIITLKDKTSADYSLSRPLQFLSAKAIERRTRQGIAVTSSDIPVTTSYINAIKSMGADVKYQSRWLNTIIVESADTAFIRQASSLPYVKRIQRFTGIKSAGIKTAFEKPFFQHESISSKGGASNYKSGSGYLSYDYGFADNQISMLKGNLLHDLGFRGQGMTIAVIDAGFNSVNVLHAFDSLWANHQILGTRDFVEPQHDLFRTDISTHGMMVLSTMGANMPGQIVGTAPKASYWLLRSEDATAEYMMEEYFWVNAAEYADSVGADIISSSLGYTTFDNPLQNHSYADMNGRTTVISVAAELAAQKGMLVVNSAGNSGSVTDPWKYINAPADGDSVFTVGAVDSQGKRASFSSKGPTSDRRIKPNMAAQGVGTAVVNLSGKIAFGSGTSFSAPIIAGMTACLWQANMASSNMEIIQALQKSGSQANNPDSLLGYGIPNYMTANYFLSLNEHHSDNSNHDIFIQPNPFSTGFTIDFSSHPPNGHLKITLKTMTGSHVYESSYSRTGSSMIVLDKLANLAPGIYILFIQAENNYWARKVIKL